MSSVYLRAESRAYQCDVVVGDKNVRGSLATKDKKKAERIGAEIQALADALSPAEKRTQAQLTRFVGKIFDAAGIAPPWEVTSTSLKFSVFANRWLERKRAGSSKMTLQAASATIAGFAQRAGDHAMSNYTGEMVQAWHDKLVAEHFAPNTVNVRLSVIKAIFRHAFNLGTIRNNPAAEILTDTPKSVIDREEFPDDLFKKVFDFLYSSEDWTSPDWRIAMMLGRHAGLRLRDAVSVTREQFDPTKGILCYTALKTGRTVCIPVFDPLLGFLRQNYPLQKFCPALHGKSAAYLSNKFSEIVTLSGVANEKTAVASGREYQAYTFHALRHAFVTDLAKRGIPEHLRMILSDHSTVKSARVYDHSTAVNLADQVSQYFK